MAARCRFIGTTLFTISGLSSGSLQPKNRRWFRIHIRTHRTTKHCEHSVHSLVLTKPPQSRNCCNSGKRASAFRLRLRYAVEDFSWDVLRPRPQHLESNDISPPKTVKRNARHVNSLQRSKGHDLCGRSSSKRISRLYVIPQRPAYK
jgi:hypothetical protein